MLGIWVSANVPPDLIPTEGMLFDSLEEGENFYRSYARNVGFRVRRGPGTKKKDVLMWKRFLCSKEGFRVMREPDTGKGQGLLEGSKTKCNRKLTRCGCEAMVVFKRTTDDKYKINKFVDRHTHALAPLSKKQFQKANGEVNASAKSMLLTCHEANTVTSTPDPMLKVQSGGYENIGCTEKDMQNYHGDMKVVMKSSEALFVVDTLKMKKEYNPSFFCAYEVDDQGRLTHVFWADSICRNNYAWFGDVVSLDTTYKTNKYGMICAPFTGVNHHMSCVSFDVAFLENDTIESYTWLFENFLRAMRGIRPRLIITNEVPGTKVAIENVLKTTKHKISMWHILKKLSKEIDASLRNNARFADRFQSCVCSSESPEKFESSWSSIIFEFVLEGNEWLSKKYGIRESWVAAYFKDMFLGGMLKTTRSECENTFFSNFVNRWLSLVEFWVIFDTALEYQRKKQSLEDNDMLHKMPELKSTSSLEKHAREVFTQKIFGLFQVEMLATRDDCAVTIRKEEGAVRVVTVVDLPNGKSREVRYNASSHVAQCSCKLFESEGFPCRHILIVLKGALLNELPQSFILDRWTKMSTRKPIFDIGRLPEGCSADLEIRKMIADTHAAFSEALQIACQSEEKMRFLRKGLHDFVRQVAQMASSEQSQVQGCKSYNGSTVPEQVDIHLPDQVHLKGAGKRIQEGLEIEQRKRVPRLCTACGEYAFHDSRNCPTKTSTWYGRS